jgi:hypothetical protein
LEVLPLRHFFSLWSKNLVLAHPVIWEELQDLNDKARPGRSKRQIHVICRTDIFENRCGVFKTDLGSRAVICGAEDGCYKSFRLICAAGQACPSCLGPTSPVSAKMLAAACIAIVDKYRELHFHMSTSHPENIEGFWPPVSSLQRKANQHFQQPAEIRLNVNLGLRVVRLRELPEQVKNLCKSRWFVHRLYLEVNKPGPLLTLPAKMLADWAGEGLATVVLRVHRRTCREDAARLQDKCDRAGIAMEKWPSYPSWSFGLNRVEELTGQA